MKPGDLVLLQGGLWSSYGREGEVGLVMEAEFASEKLLIPSNPDLKFVRVLWDDGDDNLYKIEHLKIISCVRVAAQ